MKKLLKIVALLLLLLLVAIGILMALSRPKCGGDNILSKALGYLSHSKEKCVEPLTVIPGEWLTCQSDSDCTVVLSYCAWEPTNKASAAATSSVIQQKYNLGLIEYDCPQAFKDAPKPAASCVNQHCVISEVRN